MVTEDPGRRSAWQLQEAKNRLSEVVRRAASVGPQTITLHGKPTAVLISYEQFVRSRKPEGSLVEFLASSPLRDVDLDLERDRDEGRDLPL